MLAINTDNVRPRERVDYWADAVSRHVTPMRIEPTGRQALRGEVHARAIGPLTVAEVSGHGIRALHTRSEIASTRGHLYAACVSLDGDARIVRHGAHVALERGDVFITDSRDEFALELDRPWRHLVISIDTNWIDSRITRPERIAGTVVRDHPLARLWAHHLADGFALSNKFSPRAAALFAEHSLALLAQALEELHHGRPSRSDAGRAATFLHACRIISLRFAEPDLAPSDIAHELHMSTRSLSRLFALHGETVMGRVFDERVQQAMTLLASAAAGHRPITEIAFACGFNDSSHFGRVFAARTHMTPSRWRTQHC
jgi:AraC-like DNA-binding protein